VDESLTGDELVRVVGEAGEEVLMSSGLCVDGLIGFGETVGSATGCSFWAGSLRGGPELKAWGPCGVPPSMWEEEVFHEWNAPGGCL